MSACVQPISCEAQRHSQACRGLTTAAGHRQLSSIADSPLSEVTGCTQPEADQLRSGSAPQRVPSVVGSTRTSGKRHQADARPGGRQRLRCQLFDVQQHSSPKSCSPQTDGPTLYAHDPRSGRFS